MSDHLHVPAALLPVKKAPGTDWIRGGVGPRLDLNDQGVVQPVASRYADCGEVRLLYCNSNVVKCTKVVFCSDNFSVLISHTA
jgi:hypothetical protein